MDSSEDSYTCMGDCCQLYFSAHFFISVFWENKFSLIYHMKQVNFSVSQENCQAGSVLFIDFNQNIFTYCISV